MKIDGGVDAVGVVPYGTNKIEGSSSKSLATQWDKIVITADGSSTWILESSGGV